MYCVLGIVVICVLMCLLLMPDCWLDVSVRKVLRPATTTQVFFLGFPVPLKQMLRWFPSPSYHYMLLMYPSRCKFSSTASSSCICVKNDCHRVKTQLQLNKYYLFYLFMYLGPCSPDPSPHTHTLTPVQPRTVQEPTATAPHC